ncbi:23S rRNA (pseudouridine(1915)-N(3))-methyltransferase RlmH, partial [Rhodoblastus sp.]|uniref:23S rRNA (pseudouridine(1915)-N(3))-methyltransferase RlmH n=1 Tax=Rhodoblastus sp. TaxID=1962975 RepID=UPI0035B47109
MKLLLVGVGRLKAGPERELVARYAERCVAGGRKIGFNGFDLREIDESRARRPEDRKAEEAATLDALLPQGARKICLDERGRNLSSEDFARKLGEWRDAGAPVCAMMIGGPDGFDPAFRDRADLTLAFGAMT